MKYYEIDNVRDYKITGGKGDGCPIYFTQEFWDKNPAVYDFIRGSGRLKYWVGEMPDYEIHLNGLRMDWTTKMLDILPLTGMTGFIVHSRVREIIEKFHLPNHRFYTAKFIKYHKITKERLEIENYFWFYFNYETGEQHVNFERSKFLTKGVPPRSFKVYMEIFEKYGNALSAYKLYFNDSFDKTLDFWGTSYLTGKSYISERLLKEFEKNKITGYEAIEPRYCKLFFEGDETNPLMSTL